MIRKIERKHLKRLNFLVSEYFGWWESQTCKESAAVLQRDVIIAPLPGSLADLADDEEDDGEGCAQQGGDHQELEAEDHTLKHSVTTWEQADSWSQSNFM